MKAPDKLELYKKNEMKDVIIIGAGIAGLSAGFELHKNNIDFQILEPTNRVGGSIETVKVRDYLVESGPNTFSSLSKETMELVEDLDIEDLLQVANPQAKKRYIYRNGQLIPVPSTLKEFIKTDILSREGKITLLEELFIKKEEKEETVQDFTERRFGREVLKNFIQPFLNGVFAGDVQKLSANAVFPKLKGLESKYRSIIGGMFLSQKFRSSFKGLTLYSFINGMETLPNEIYNKLKNKTTLGANDIEISRAKDFFIVNFKVNNKTINYTANSILFALPAHAMSEFAYLLPKDYASEITQIEYAPVATVVQVTDKSNIGVYRDTPEGFGFLCTKEPHRKLLGTIWTSSVFPNRAPSDKTLLTSYVGGALNKKITDQSEEEIASLTAKEVSETMKISDQNLLETIYVKVNSNAIPQYNLGHMSRIKKIEELMDKNYGLFFTGNYLYGISINDTVKASKLAVERIKKFLDITIKKQEALVSK